MTKRAKPPPSRLSAQESLRLHLQMLRLKIEYLEEKVVQVETEFDTSKELRSQRRQLIQRVPGSPFSKHKEE
jgi:hypothetical protein